MDNNFTVFDELLYKNCHYNQLFSCFNYFMVDYTKFILNDVFYYDGEECTFQLKTKSVRNEEEIFFEIGIEYQKIPYTSDLLNTILSCFDRQGCSILPIDCYFYPLRQESFGKHHMAHSITAYGADRIQHVFYIIDSPSIDSLLYLKRTMDYNIVLKCCEGYRKFINEDMFIGQLYKLSDQHITNENEYPLIYRRNYKSNIEFLENGMRKLENFCYYYIDVIKDQYKLDEIKELLFECVQQLNVFMKVRLYQYRKQNQFMEQNNDEKMDYYLQEIKTNWSSVYNIFVKFILSKKYNSNSFENSIMKIGNNLELEKKVFGLLKNTY